MKTKAILISAILSGSVLALSGCDDFLNEENTTSLNQETFFDSDETISEATAPLYNYVWYNFNEKFYYGMGDGKANNITAQYSKYIYPYTNLNETGLSEGLSGAWGSFYCVIAQSNNVINNITKYATDNCSEEAKLQGIAEARFMRGLAYWYLSSLWNRAIIYENTDNLVNNYVVPANSGVDVMEFAIRDMEYAAKYLPTTSAATGRVNKYSAYGMLSRFYLSMAGMVAGDNIYDQTNAKSDFNDGHRNTSYLNLAKAAAQKVITESGASLMDNYGDLFTYANNNCKEDLFQFQWLSGSTAAIGWGCNQAITAFFGWSTSVTDATNWGGATYCSWDLYQVFIAGYAGCRRHYCVADYGAFYPEMNTADGGYTYGKTDSPGSQGANIKKYVIGTIKDNGVSYQQSSGLNTHMLRLAEVYLNYVEAAFGDNDVLTDATALAYFNKVRERAYNGDNVEGTFTAVSTLNFTNMNKAGEDFYKGDSYMDERRMELAFEGQYWYDLVRRSYYKQSEVVGYMNNQDRNRSYKYNTETGIYEASADKGAGVATATEANLFLPVSDADKAKNHYLGESTVAYSFVDREVSHADLGLTE